MYISERQCQTNIVDIAIFADVQQKASQMAVFLNADVKSSDSGHGCAYEHDGTDQREYVSRNFEHALDLSFFGLDFLFAFALHDVEPKTFCLTVFVLCVFQKFLMGSRLSFTS